MLQVTVDEDVPLLRPIARDDRVLAEDVEDGTVDLEVLANDEDPDGTVDDLEVEVEGGAARVLSDGTVRITLDDEEHLLRYTITDRDGLEASAFIHVPSLDGLRADPHLDRGHRGAQRRDGRDPARRSRARVGAARRSSSPRPRRSRRCTPTARTSSRTRPPWCTPPSDGYFGQDAITFEVTDGTGPDDPEGLKATLTLPVTVLPPDNQQPTFIGGQMNVAPGEDPTSLDLAALTTDPDPEDLPGMRYSIVGGAPAGLTRVDQRPDRSRSAPIPPRPRARRRRSTVRIDDGETEPVEGTVVVAVTASTRPLPTANDDTVAEAHQGTTVTRAGPRQRLQPVPRRAAEGRRRGDRDRQRLRRGGGRCRRGEPRRDVRRHDGRALPHPGRDRPTSTAKSRAASSSPCRAGPKRRARRPCRACRTAPWCCRGRRRPTTAPRSRATPCSSTRGDYEKQCAATTCTLDGLTNNVEYNFTVIATNRVGDSDPSAPSETARPDARPDTPAPPTLTFGDRSLNVAWVTPTTPGSPVESFTLEISPAPPSGIAQKTEVDGQLDRVGRASRTASRTRCACRRTTARPTRRAGAGGPPPRSPRVLPSRRPRRAWRACSRWATRRSCRSRGSSPPPTAPTSRGTSCRCCRAAASCARSPSRPRRRARPCRRHVHDRLHVPRAGEQQGGLGRVGRDLRAAARLRRRVRRRRLARRRRNRSLVSYSPAAGNGATAGELRYEYSLNGGGWAALPGNHIGVGCEHQQQQLDPLRAIPQSLRRRCPGSGRACWPAP